jgi:chromosomal replication initiation ATPase DnaA
MSHPEQLPLALPARRAQGRDAFFVAEPNRLALALIDGWRAWPAAKCLLIGPQGSGKSHLAHVWAEDAEARVISAAALPEFPPEGGNVAIEDAHLLAAHAAAQETLFHWHNAVLAGGGRLLVTGRGRLPEWGLSLPDLVSRLDAAPVARLEAPDDALLMAVLVKLFEDRHIAPPADLIGYLAARIERSFTAAARVVERLDRHALRTGRRIGLRLARAVLEQDQNAD